MNHLTPPLALKILHPHIKKPSWPETFGEVLQVLVKNSEDDIKDFKSETLAGIKKRDQAYYCLFIEVSMYM